MGIPVLLVIGLIATWCVGIASTAVVLGSAASTAARSLARGEQWEDVIAKVERTAPGAHATVLDEGDLVRVEVERDIAAPALLQSLSVRVTRSAAALREWSADATMDVP